MSFSLSLALITFPSFTAYSFSVAVCHLFPSIISQQPEDTIKISFVSFYSFLVLFSFCLVFAQFPLNLFSFLWFSSVFFSFHYFSFVSFSLLSFSLVFFRFLFSFSFFYFLLFSFSNSPSVCLQFA